VVTGEDSAARLLANVRSALAELEAALDGGDVSRGVPADRLVQSVGDLLERVERDPATDDELIAGLRVLRNGAFAFRRLAQTEGRADQALAESCRVLLERGREHLERSGC
jgi:hypothetical protein